jgi:hypothetical protein
MVSSQEKLKEMIDQAIEEINNVPLSQRLNPFTGAALRAAYDHFMLDLENGLKESIGLQAKINKNLDELQGQIDTGNMIKEKIRLYKNTVDSLCDLILQPYPDSADWKDAKHNIVQAAQAVKNILKE